MHPMMSHGGGSSVLWLVVALLSVLAVAGLGGLLLTRAALRGRGPLRSLAGRARERTARRRLPGAMRASDADREQAAAALKEHVVAGRITPEELDDRLTAVYAARTLGQLREVLADLPGADLPGADPDGLADRPVKR